MLCNDFEEIKKLVFKKLGQLEQRFTYHNLSHTTDVLDQSVRIAFEEKVSGDDLYLLKVAALYHDSGFLRTYKNHEEMSCEIFLEDAVHFRFSEEQIKKISAMIMATKLPQRPGTLLEQIICDADLDYLGRDDFDSISKGLQTEFFAFGIVNSVEQWDNLQLDFLNNHHYHTSSSRKQREPVKQRHLLNLS